MRKKHVVFTLTLIIITALTLCAFSACNGGPRDDAGVPTFPPGGSDSPNGSPSSSVGNENGIKENPVIDTATQNDLYFSVDAHTAEYTQLKDMILNGTGYDAYASHVKIDQMLNYFKYDYSTPQEDELLALNASLFDCPYNTEKKLLRVGLKSQQVYMEDVKNNIVLLLDVSGSMSGASKIDLMKEAMMKMVDNLNQDDVISIVTYSNKTKVVIDGLTMGENAKEIKRQIGDLRADGGTNGEGGIQKAYEVAKNHFIEDGNNRVILATDGDFNIGISDVGELKEFISSKKDDGIYLTCIGLGNDYGYATSTMEALSKSGNGYWGYIHNMGDAEKLLVEDLASTIITIAKDVKAKIAFNSDVVKNFRLLGYENNIISSIDYEDKTTDAGEIGTDFTLSLCFEIELGADVDLSQELNIAEVNIRYKDAKANTEDPSSELKLPITSDCYTLEMSQDDSFVSSVVEFALIALNSQYKANANIDNVIERLQGLGLSDKYKAEFVQVVTTYKNLMSNVNR
ncbi:MAG: DUF3520 domain-containing protein [Clostridiales bacterium]|nr:DUF3520 domain-containing protein [Clostridiales bacterium]